MSPDANLMQDLGEARRIQMSMLPQTVPQFQGFEMAAHCTPAAAVGGDFYDFIQLGQDRLGVVVGDAVGHGIAAALLMTMTLTDFRSIALREASAAAVLNSVNRRLTQGMRSRVFVTSVYAVLDRANHRLTCAMGGQQPWVVKAKTGRCQPIEPPGSRIRPATWNWRREICSSASQTAFPNHLTLRMKPMVSVAWSGC